jgi:hypothetical protein
LAVYDNISLRMMLIHEKVAFSFWSKHTLIREKGQISLNMGDILLGS